MDIRNATKNDLDSIMEIEFASFIPGIQEERIVFENRIKMCGESFLVFEDENKKVFGYLCAERMSKIPERVNELELGHFPNVNKNGSVLYISSFAIFPEYRGNGTGSYVWEQSLNFLKNLKGIKTIVLLVNESWTGAHHIYEKSGFYEICRLPSFFYAEDDSYTDGILMQKNI